MRAIGFILLSLGMMLFYYSIVGLIAGVNYNPVAFLVTRQAIDVSLVEVIIIIGLLLLYRR